MRLPKRTWIFSCVAVGALLLVFVDRPPQTTIAVGSPVPDFALPSASGQTVSLAALRGEVLLINFWATWCYTCATEMPALNRLAEHFVGRPFQIIGISEDGETGGGWAAIADYRRQIPIAFSILLDPDGHVADAYGTYGIPESYLVDAQGHLVQKIRGAVVWDGPTMITAIEQLLPRSRTSVTN